MAGKFELSAALSQIVMIRALLSSNRGYRTGSTLNLGNRVKLGKDEQPEHH